MTQAHIFISGYVHSVGFRRFVEREAIKRGLRGFVRNLSDRRVEAVIQGNRERIEELIELSYRGPMMAEVKSVNVVWEEIKKDFIGFEILKTERV